MDDSIPENTSDDYLAREKLWDDQWPGSRKSGHPPEEPDNLDEELPFPESVGTSDVIESVRDQEPYSPPTDPPVLAGGDQGVHIATGFGRSAEEEQAGNPPPRGDVDLREEILLLLREDSDTNALPLDVDVQGGIVRLVGAVPSALDAERATTLIGNVQGVVDVIDDTLIEPTA